METLDVDAIRFDEDDLDAALLEVAIATDLSVEVQRSLASRVLITASLASAIENEASYQAAIARLGSLPEDLEEAAFFASFSRSIAVDLASEIENADSVQLLARRIDAMSA